MICTASSEAISSSFKVESSVILLTSTFASLAMMPKIVSWTWVSWTGLMGGLRGSGNNNVSAACRLNARRSGCRLAVGDALEKGRRAIDHDFALLVDRDHVVALLQDHRFDRAADAALDATNVRQAGHIVFLSVHDEAGRDDLRQQLTHAPGQPVELCQRGPWIARQAGFVAVSAQHRAGDALADALVLDAVRELLVELGVLADAEADRHRQQE